MDVLSCDVRFCAANIRLFFELGKKNRRICTNCAILGVGFRVYGVEAGENLAGGTARAEPAEDDKKEVRRFIIGVSLAYPRLVVSEW